MKYSTAAALLIAATGASAASNSSVVYVTDVVTAYTTYCPAATVITHGTQTYSVTEATTLTITDCPCTITKPVSSAVATSAVSSAVGIAPIYNNGTGSGSSTKTSVAGAASGTGASTASAGAVKYTGAAVANTVSGAGLAAIFGLVAYAL